jgi:heptosyltransferase-2
MQDSRLLRAVDRYIGSALCAGISAFKFTNAKPQSKRSIQKILLIELFEMGATVMLIPSIRKLKEKFPHAEIHCLTTSASTPIWLAIGEIPANRIHTIQAGSAFGFVISILKTVLSLQRIRFDLIIDYELFMRIPALISGLLRARERAGFYRYDLEGLYRGSFYQHKSAYNQKLARYVLGFDRFIY